MPTRKPGVCRVCGRATSRTSITTCANCQKPNAAKKADEVASLIAAHVAHARADIQQMAADLRRRAPVLAAPTVDRSGIMVELMVPDLHLGKLAWGEETGHGNYDSKEAKRLYREAVGTLVERTKWWKPERFVFVVGQDFFHSDTLQGTTTKGTPLDTDGRFQKMFREGREMLTDIIEGLHRKASVDVICSPGNHDQVSAWTLGEALECWFHNTPTVRVFNAPTPRKYYEWGRVMLAWEHGDRGRKLDGPLLMATEQPTMFGRTTFRELHTGHLHKLQTEERMGVRVRVSPSLSGTDAWHNHNGYVGNWQQAEAFVWSKTQGLVAQAFYTA